MLTFVGNFPFSSFSGRDHGFDATPGPVLGSFLVAMTATGDDGFIHRIIRQYGTNGSPVGADITIDSTEASGSGAGTIRIKMIDSYRFAVVWYQDSDQTLYAITSDIDNFYTSPKRVLNTPGFFVSTVAPGSFISPVPSSFAGYDILSNGSSGFTVVWGNGSYASNYSTGATDDAPAYTRMFDYDGEYAGPNQPANYLGSLNPSVNQSFGLVAGTGANGGFGIAFNIYNTSTLDSSTYFTAFDSNNNAQGTPVLALTPASTSVTSISGTENGYKITHHDPSTWYRSYVTSSVTLSASRGTIGRSVMNGEYYIIQTTPSLDGETFTQSIILYDSSDNQLDVENAVNAEFYVSFPVGNSRVVVCGVNPASAVAGVGSGAPTNYQAQVSVYDASPTIRRAVFFL